MTERANVEVNGGPGCLFLFGGIIIAICVGNIYSAVHGWLAFGAFLILWAICGSVLEMRTMRVKR